MRRGITLATAAFLAAVVAVGCGGGPELAAVQGTVKYKGQPLKEGSITFHPAKGRPAHGQIKDGMIVGVTTERQDDGVAVGPVKVAVTAISNANDMYAKHQALIPESYGNADKSGLTADIKSGLNEVAFDLK